MNERIQTLLAKFKETESTHRGAHVLIGSDEIEKFAELIVRECANIVQDSPWQLPQKYKSVDQANLIKKYFGVEE